MIVFVMAAFAFVSASLLAYAALASAFSEGRGVRRGLEQLSAYEAGQLAEAQPLIRPFSSRVFQPIGRRSATIGRALAPKEYEDRVSHRLVLAGLQGKWGLDRFLSIKLLSTLAGIGLAVLARMWLTLPSLPSLLLTLGLPALGFFAVDLYLHAAVSRRQGRIRRELPDMLDMLSISVEAGLGFDQALTKLIRTRPGALSEEFGRMLQETQAGMTRREALHHVAERTDVDELQSFVMALVQAETFGVTISQVLRAQAGELRLRRHQRAEEQAQKAPVKQVFPLVICILPATIFVVVGPAVVLIGQMFGSLGR